MNARDRSQDPILIFAIDALLENASLTDALTDEAANVLINWGISNIRKIYFDISKSSPDDLEEAMYPRLKANRKLMRTISNWTATRSEKGNEENNKTLEKTLTLIQEVYGKNVTVTSIIEKTSFMHSNLTNPTTEFISQLRKLFDKTEEE